MTIALIVLGVVNLGLLWWVIGVVRANDAHTRGQLRHIAEKVTALDQFNAARIEQRRQIAERVINAGSGRELLRQRFAAHLAQQRKPESPK